MGSWLLLQSKLAFVFIDNKSDNKQDCGQVAKLGEASRVMEEVTIGMTEGFPGEDT